jgi:RNA polymerase sigma-70 factor (ECF subfamily)
MISANVQTQNMESTEEDLDIKAQAGDHVVFGTLYRIHLGQVSTICLRILLDRSTADVTPKIFIHAWVKLKSFRRSSQFSSWLYRLSVNLILDELKQQGSRSSHKIENDQGFSQACYPSSLPNLG